LEACQYQLDNERPIKAEQLVSATPSFDVSNEDYEKQINQLQQKLSQYEDERTLLRERLNEVELELSKTSDDRTSTLAMYEKQFESLMQERDALVEQQTMQSEAQ
jgi:chromosome segregation ATPase